MTDLVIPETALEDCGAILGRRGAGKSNALMTLFEHELDAGHRCVMVDPKGDRWGIRLTPEGKPSRFEIPIFGGDRADVALGEDQGAALAELIATSDTSCLIDLSHMHLGAQQRFMLDFSRSLYRHNRAALTLFLEEVDQFASQDQKYQKAELLHHIQNLVKLGRQRGIIVWMASQRPAQVNKNLLSQIETLIAMAARSPQDRDAIGDWFKGHSAEADKLVRQALAGLKPGEAIVWTGDDVERVAFPMASTFDSGRRPKHGEQVEHFILYKFDVSELADRLGAEPAPLPNVTAMSDGIFEKALAERDKAAADFLNQCDITNQQRRRIAELKEALTTLQTLIAPINQFLSETLHPGAPQDEVETAGTPPEPAVSAPPAVVAASPPAANGDGRTPATFAPRHQRLLDAVAWAETFLKCKDVERRIVAFVAGVSPKSSSYANDISFLSANGYLAYPSGGAVMLTDEGRAQAIWLRSAGTTDELVDRIADKIETRHAQMLRTLVTTYPLSMTRKLLADTLGKSATSSSFANDVSFLSGLGLAFYPAPGAVKAANWMFP